MGRNLTDEDAKFLAAMEEARRQQEQAIQQHTESALQEFKVKHELMAREMQRQAEQSERIETIQAVVTNASVQGTRPTVTKSINAKRTLMGIAPKKQ